MLYSTTTSEKSSRKLPHSVKLSLMQNSWTDVRRHSSLNLILTKMHFSGRGAARETPHGLIVCLVIIFFQPVVFGEEQGAINPGSQGQIAAQTQPSCPTVTLIRNYVIEARSATVMVRVSAKEHRIEYYAVRYRSIRHRACPLSYVNETYVTLPNVTGQERVTISDLQPYTTYEIQIAAKCAESGLGRWARRAFFTRPSAPPRLNATVPWVRSTTLKLVWNPLTCSTVNGRFRKYTAVITDGKRVIKHDLLTNISSSSTTFTALDPCTNYTLTLFAANFDRIGSIQGLQGPNNTLYARTIAEAPGKPTNISVLKQSGSVSVDMVTWKAPPDRPCPAERYNVTYKLLNKDMCNKYVEVTKYMSAENQTEQNIQGLLPNSKYKICVYGLNGGGSGNSTCEHFKTGYKEPSKPPKIVELTDSSYYNLTFAWEKPRCGYRNGPITHYEYILNAPGTNDSKDGNVMAHTNGGNVTVNGLVPGTTYYFRVRASNFDLSGNYGRALEANTIIAVYTPPRNINVTTLTETTAVVEWNLPLPSNLTITGYRIEYWMTNREENTSIVVSCETDSCRPAGVMYKTITGLRPATSHTLQVIAVYKYGEKASSSTIFKTTKEDDGSSNCVSRKATMIPVLLTIFMIIIFE